MGEIDFSSLGKALKSLQEAVELSKESPSDEIIRDAVIQRFEYTFELCWKHLKRYLEQEGFNSPDRILNYKDMIRDAAQMKLLDNPEMWFKYREARNLTVHTYDRSNAESVYLSALSFLSDATSLFTNLKQQYND